MIDANKRFPRAVDAKDQRHMRAIARGQTIAGMFGGFDDIEGELVGDFL